MITAEEKKKKKKEKKKFDDLMREFLIISGRPGGRGMNRRRRLQTRPPAFGARSRAAAGSLRKTTAEDREERPTRARCGRFEAGRSELIVCRGGQRARGSAQGSNPVLFGGQRRSGF